jgi:hypothetical protein
MLVRLALREPIGINPIGCYKDFWKQGKLPALVGDLERVLELHIHSEIINKYFNNFD